MSKIVQHLYDRVAYTMSEDGIVRKRFGRIECVDGFSMSVQASSTHYCSPREDDADWCRVEVGFPSSPEPLLLPYASSSDVYGYVPVEVVDAVIDSHGGIKED